MKLFAIPYSILCYLIGVASLVAMILFVGGLFLPWTINTGSPVSLGLTGGMALIGNVALVTIWSLQHSIMADPAFKRVWTRIVPPAVERSTYMLVVGGLTFALLALWSPMPDVIWDVSGTWVATALIAGYLAGWTITFISTFLINHFHLFGLQQAWEQHKQVATKDQSFVTPFFYKFVRHPMMTGVLIALWCAPTLTVGRLVFNIAMTIYVIVGIMHEESTLIEELGEEYEEYRKTTPMVVPGPKLGDGK
ncbi:MAG: isoprenylcysteine carboxylmethyltransferase family protein [Erythrobacter sp.]